MVVDVAHVKGPLLDSAPQYQLGKDDIEEAGRIKQGHPVVNTLEAEEPFDLGSDPFLGHRGEPRGVRGDELLTARVDSKAELRCDSHGPKGPERIVRNYPRSSESDDAVIKICEAAVLVDHCVPLEGSEAGGRKLPERHRQ